MPVWKLEKWHENVQWRFLQDLQRGPCGSATSRAGGRPPIRRRKWMRTSVVKVRRVTVRGTQPPAQVWAPLMLVKKCYFRPMHKMCQIPLIDVVSAPWAPLLDLFIGAATGGRWGRVWTGGTASGNVGPRLYAQARRNFYRARTVIIT